MLRRRWVLDPYSALGVPQGTADNKVLTKAFRKLSRLHHPDLGGDADKFSEIQEAYDVLTGKLDINKSRFASGFGLRLVQETTTFSHFGLFSVRFKARV